MDIKYRGIRNIRGNILFIILLAVVLFAALNYAVTQSIRGDGKYASPEKLDLELGQMRQLFTNLENTMMRMKLTKGVRDDQFYFRGDNMNTTITNIVGGWGMRDCYQCPTSFSPFAADGGNLIYGYKPPTWMLKPQYAGWGGIWSGGMQVLTADVVNTGTDEDDILLQFGGFTNEIALYINKQNGISCLPQESFNARGYDNSSLSANGIVDAGNG